MRELSTEHARVFFTSLGFTVEDIPVVDGQRRADLRATFHGEEYVIEAKFREPHREWHAAMERADIDGFATTSRNIEPWSVLSNAILKARTQLVATPASDAAFRILWVVALHDDDKFVIACVEKRLLGVHLLFTFGDLTVSPKALDCYYYDDNDFERCPEIDAAMLCTREGAQLFVNHYSPNRERFRASSLYSEVSAKRAVVDAEIRTRDGRALMLDADFDRPRVGNAQWQYLRDKHGILISPATESQFYGVMLVPAAVVAAYAEKHGQIEATSEISPPDGSQTQDE